MNDLTVITVLLIGAGVVALVVALTHNARLGAQRRSATAAYFAAHYGSSVDRMVEESPANRERLRAIRDASRSGPARAARELLASEPVPLDVAAEFIRRI